MFLKMLAFEWRYFTRQPSFIVTCMVFFLFPFLAMTIENVQIGSSANVNFNSPFAISQMILIMGILSMFLVVNFVSDTALRNDTSKMAEIISTKPITPVSYQLGRFIGAYLVCVTVFGLVPLGLLVGSLMPWLDPERLGPISLANYFKPFIYFSLTTIFVMASIFYAAALKFRSQIGVYLVALGLFIIYVVSGNFLNEPAYRTLAALSDPYGIRAFNEISRYWTTFERNTLSLTLDTLIIQNRIIWLIVGVVVLGTLGGLHNSLKLYTPKDKKKKHKQQDETIPLGNRITIKPGKIVGMSHFITRTGFEIKQIMTSPAFYILLLFSMFNLIGPLIDPSSLYDAPNWPLTQTMVNLIVGAFGLMMIIVVTYYSAETIWRERSMGMGDIIDSMPVRNINFWLSKLLAVCLVIVSIYVISTLVTISYQLIKGFDHIDIAQYVTSLGFFYLPSWIFLTVLAFFIQAMSPNKYVGMLIFFGYFIVSLVTSQLGIEHNMYQFSGAPILQFSDMNRYGWFITTQSWYLLYWGALCLVMGVVSYGLWQRGPQVSLKAKFFSLKYNIGKVGTGAIAAGVLVFMGSGYVIYQNTQVTNTFTTQDSLEDLQEAYEKQFIEFSEDDIPTITSVDANVDIYPYQHRIEATASIEFENKADVPIERFLVNYPRESTDVNLELEGGSLGDKNDEFDLAWFTFNTPLQPGEIRKGTLSIIREHKGFKDRGFDTLLVENGTFINNGELFPTFGFNFGARISDRNERRKRDLPELQRAYPIDDVAHQKETFIGKGGAEIMFSATLSTSADQFAIAPGYLAKEWQENGRNYYRYEMDKPILNFYSMMSAKLASKKETYKGIAVEVYYHPEHYWNVDRMMESVRDSIDYFSEAFGPYQHKQLRIIEFPGYRSFAQSFANTVPYSEQIGFITDLRDESNIDPVYYVTAHEVAHQWWGHQVIPANVQGSAVLSESLSQYSALMVMEKKYGEARIRTFLTYELDRYLRGRTGELIQEMPMLLSENQQYIHYRKGSVVMMALKDKLGEARLNASLKSLVDKWYGRSDLYPTTRDLVAALKTNATPEEQTYIDSIFNEITLYEFVNKSAVATESDQGYTVTIDINATKFIADGQGKEAEKPLEEWVDVVLFANDPDDFEGNSDIIYSQKHKVVSGENQIKINVDVLPKYAGVDPFVRYIDRDTDNNILAVSQ